MPYIGTRGVHGLARMTDTLFCFIERTLGQFYCALIYHPGLQTNEQLLK